MAGLRQKALVWTTGATVVILLAGTLFLGMLLRQQLSSALDEGLTLRARAAATAVETWLAAQDRLSGSLIGQASGDAGVRRVFAPRTDVPSDQPAMLSLLDKDGQTVLTSHQPSSGQLPSVDVPVGTALLTDAENRVEEYRVVTMPVRWKNSVVGYVRALTPLSGMRRTLARIETTLGISAATLLFLNAWLVGFAVQTTLRPLDRLVADIHRISERNLSMRVPVPRARNEIRRLADTFNQMLDRLDQGFRFQTQLFQDLSHQLKTPLAVLTGTLETTLGRARTAEEYRSILESNLDEVGRMTHLIESLLLLAQLDSKHVELKTRDVDLVEFYRSWTDDFSLLWEAKSLTPVWSTDGPLPVRIDPDRMAQPFLNLLDNAVKHSPDGGRLTFRFRRSGTHAVFEIENEGPPLAPGSEETIFVRFNRHGNSGKGFGLGLPIARAAVELHGGTLVAYQPPVCGAGFRMELPLRIG